MKSRAIIFKPEDIADHFTAVPTGYHLIYRGRFHPGGINHSTLEQGKNCIKAYARILIIGECHDFFIGHIWMSDTRIIL